MKRLAVAAIAALTIAVLCAAPAGAQGIRSFVSALGSDSNNCGRGSPCRSFAAALQATNPFGEIVVLDPAGYGPLTINKSVSIVNDGAGLANVTNGVSGTNAITINAGANDVINLRGLTINGVGIDVTGIAFSGGGTLNVQNCVIRGFTANGISYTPTLSSHLTLVDTIVSNIGGTAAAVLLQPTGSGLTVTAYLDGVQVSGNNQHAIDVNTQTMSGGSLTATVANSVLTDNPNGAGVLIPTLSGPTVTLINTRLTNNGVGLNAGGGAAYLAETTISGNTGNGFIVRPGASVLTFGNNRITDTNNLNSLTPIAKQ